MGSWEKTGERVERGPFSAILCIGGLFMFIVLFIGVASFVGNPFAQAARVVNKTIDADNVIYNYEYFKKQWRAVDAIDRKIIVQREAVTQFKGDAGLRKEWGYEDKTECARISSIVTGLEQQRADMAADYNAKAAMANRSIFMGNDCPEEIR